MNQKELSSILIVILIFLILTIISFLIAQKRIAEKPDSPPAPTQVQRDAAKKLPKSECGCWNSANNICLPQADCI